MIGKALNSENDIILNGNGFKLIENSEQVLQNVRSRLLMYKGEWALNTSSGVPYFQEIFTKPVNLYNVESILKSTILRTEGVSRLISFSLEFESTNRQLSVSFSAETEFGNINDEELTLNV